MVDKSLIRSDHEFFRLLVDAVVDYAIFGLDPHGNILSWNKGAQRLKGYSPKEIIGKHFSIFYTQEDIQRGHPADELEMATRDGVYKEEGWRVKKDGTHFWASVVITALKNEDGELQGFAKVTRDLTERKLAEDELLKANALLEKRVEERTADLENAVKARDEFLSIASHELKTPLTTLKLQNELRKHEMAKLGASHMDPGKLEKMLKSNEKQLERLIRLVDDMLDVAKITKGKFNLDLEEINLSMLVEDVLERFRAQFEIHDIHVTTLIQPDIHVKADKFRIEQVVANLLTNAIKYGDNNPVTIEVIGKNKEALMKVTDQGIGIDEKNFTRVFEQFERAVSPNLASGLGLGLYIASQIIKAHHGEIWVESQLGKGSTFGFKLQKS